jgi:lipopolysaccharide transport system ATP-binding protein
MGDLAIRVENLSKQYRLGRRARYHSLREQLTEAVKVPLRRLRRQPRAPDPGTFFALDDVSFEVQRGDVVGVIGRNGAGKSTLLKVLSRITEPTGGTAEVHGRVGSLLEVGTGFHFELTGRENVFLNGAILGMSSREIRRKFDEIVAFSEVEAFLDTPVKHYSSGMYMRLAFAVAAHLEPEILMVDEVLAVGDAAFQKKCLGRMGEVARGGRTVLFVSHNMMAIEKICQKVLFLEKGRVRRYGGDVAGIVRDCLAVGSEHRDEWANPGDLYDDPVFRPLRLRLTDGNGDRLPLPAGNDQPMWVEVEGVIEELDSSLILGYSVYGDEGQLLYMSSTKDRAEAFWPRLRAGRNVLYGRIPARLLNEGNYRVELFAVLHLSRFLVEPGTGPSVELQISGGLSDSPLYVSRRPGLLAPINEWRAGG